MSLSFLYVEHLTMRLLPLKFYWKNVLTWLLHGVKEQFEIFLNFTEFLFKVRFKIKKNLILKGFSLGELWCWHSLQDAINGRWWLLPSLVALNLLNITIFVCVYLCSQCKEQTGINKIWGVNSVTGQDWNDFGFIWVCRTEAVVNLY